MPKQLILIRHAQASKASAGMSDFERPLTDAGSADAPLMGQRLAQRGIQPDLLVSSPARRALTTATLIAQEIGYATERIATDHIIYDATAGNLLSVVQQLDDAHQLVCLCGHNPGITELSHYLTDAHIGSLPTGGVFCVELPIDSWAAVEPRSGRTVFFDHPAKET
jgi:phosphohistidine phosphatase